MPAEHERAPRELAVTVAHQDGVYEAWDPSRHDRVGVSYRRYVPRSTQEERDDQAAAYFQRRWAEAVASAPWLAQAFEQIDDANYARDRAVPESGENQ